MAVNAEEFAKLFSEVLRVDHEIKGNVVEYDLSRFKAGFVANLDLIQLTSILETLNVKQSHEQTVIYDNRSYEVLVNEENRFGVPILRRESEIVKDDNDNGIKYEISLPTDEYLLFLMSNVNESGSVALLRSPIGIHRLRRHYDNGGSEDDILHIMKLFILSRPSTLKISSTKNRNIQEFINHSNAFLFQLTYNLDIAIVEARFLDELLRTERITRGRRSNLDEIEVPRRLYTPALIYHYQMGVSTDSPILEFLSYYHIVEHFFEEIFNEDLVDGIKDKITKPDFSYKRKKDIQDLITYVNKRQRVRGDTITINELEALKLTVQKNVNFNNLLKKINEYDASLINYYKENKVSFSDGDQVDLEERDEMKLNDKLCRRIYKTRNAIVHSKENEKSRYIPFQHDKLLVKEVPLLRFIGEEVILNTSTVIA